MRPVTLADVLDAREARASIQSKLLAEYRRPLLGVTMNIAGPVKRSKLIDFAYQAVETKLSERLRLVTLHVERTDRPAGQEAVFVCDLPAAELKAIAVELETAHPVGRLYDLDVLDFDGNKLSRPVPRTCLVCGGPAGPCARSRAHGLAAVQEATGVLLRDFAAETLAEAAVRALTDEVDLTPKPGLVDRNSNGAHRDMDRALFHRSAQSLRPYFRRAVELGMERSGCMPELQQAGLEAEQTMLSVTGGVNTHKGAVYAFGLTLAALGSCLCRGGDVFGTAAALAMAGCPPRTRTHGGDARVKFGVSGARGEAAAGFPHVQRACAVLRERGPLSALLTLLAEVDDTNLLHRGGRPGLRFVQEQARSILAGPEGAYQERLAELDRDCIARNLSPGGSADLLALAFLLEDTRRIWESQIETVKERSSMRRSDREVSGIDHLVAIMEKCDVCRIALNDGGYPYILPLNFGWKTDGQRVELYFHGALTGTKYDLIRKDSRASFEMDCGHRLVTEEDRGSCTMEYESVIGRGQIEILPEEEKEEALRILMAHYHQETFPFRQAVMPQTAVFKLVVESMTGKARRVQ